MRMELIQHTKVYVSLHRLPLHMMLILELGFLGVFVNMTISRPKLVLSFLRKLVLLYVRIYVDVVLLFNV